MLSVLLVAVLSFAALARAEIFFVAEAVRATTWAWEDVDTWLSANGSSPGVLPGPDDDVVFERTNCPAKAAQGYTLTLQSNVTVRSATFASLGFCLTSFVVAPSGWLHAANVSATNGTRVFLQNGNITATAVTLEGSYLAGAGTISGEVVLGGHSTLFAGERSAACVTRHGLTLLQDRSR
jgi:hypothetical protein